MVMFLPSWHIQPLGAVGLIIPLCDGSVSSCEECSQKIFQDYSRFLRLFLQRAFLPSVKRQAVEQMNKNSRCSCFEKTVLIWSFTALNRLLFGSSSETVLEEAV